MMGYRFPAGHLGTPQPFKIPVDHRHNNKVETCEC